MECLNSDNAQAKNMSRKRRSTAEKPDSLAASTDATKKPLPEKKEEEEDSYEFDPVCENCAG